MCPESSLVVRADTFLFFHRFCFFITGVNRSSVDRLVCLVKFTPEILLLELLLLITDELLLLLLLLLLAPPLKNSGIFSTAELSNEFESTVNFELFELVLFRNSNFELVILTSSSSSSSSEDLPEDAGVVSLVASLLLLLATI